MRRSGLDGHTQAHRTKAREEETKKSALTWEATKAEALLPAASLSPLCGKRRRLGRKLVLKSVFFFPPTLCVPLCLSRKLPALSRGVWCCFFFFCVVWLLCLSRSFLPGVGAVFFSFSHAALLWWLFRKLPSLSGGALCWTAQISETNNRTSHGKKKMTWMTSQIGWLHPFNIY
jgi:hypothetical protein